VPVPKHFLHGVVGLKLLLFLACIDVLLLTVQNIDVKACFRATNSEAGRFFWANTKSCYRVLQVLWYKVVNMTLTTKEAADRLGVSIGRVHQLIQEERLPAEKKGRDYFIAEKDLRLVSNRKVGRPRTKPNSQKHRSASKVGEKKHA
jgi:excisionase family DNA binding protein